MTVSIPRYLFIKLKLLKCQSLINFDFVLIQETFEPRILMTNNNPEWKLNDKVENLKHHHLLPHEEVINFAHRPESKEEVKVDQTFIWDRHNVEYKNNKKQTYSLPILKIKRKQDILIMLFLQ